MSTHRINVATTRAHHWSYSINSSSETHITPGASYVDVTLEDGNSTIVVKAYGSGNEYLNASDTSVVAYSSCTPAVEAQATVGYSHYPGYRQQKFGGHGGKRYVFGAYANGGVGIDYTNLWAIDYLGVWRHLPSQQYMTYGSYGVPQANIGVIMGKKSSKNNTYEQRVAAFSTGIFITQGPVTRWNNYGGPRGWDGYVYVGGKDGQQVAIRPTDAQIQTASQIEICTGNENPPASILSVTANVTTNVLCHGASTGAVSCTPGGGTGGYEYVWRNSSDEEVGTTQNVTGLPSGEYTVEVTDSEFASVESSIITITQPSAPLTITSATPVKQSNGTHTVTIVATGGTGSKTYSINGSSYQSSNTFTALADGNYTAYVKDANSCVTTQAFDVTSVTYTDWDGEYYTITAGGTVFKIDSNDNNPSPILGFGTPHGSAVVGNGAFIDSWEDLGSHVLVVNVADVAHRPGVPSQDAVADAAPTVSSHYAYIGSYNESNDTFTLSNTVTTANGVVGGNKPTKGAESIYFIASQRPPLADAPWIQNLQDSAGNFKGSRTDGSYTGFTGPNNTHGNSQWFSLMYMGLNMTRTVTNTWWWTEGADQYEFPSGTQSYLGRVGYKHATTMSEAGMTLAEYNSTSYPNGHPKTQLTVTTVRPYDGTYPTIVGTTTDWPNIT